MTKAEQETECGVKPSLAAPRVTNPLGKRTEEILRAVLGGDLGRPRPSQSPDFSLAPT